MTKQIFAFYFCFIIELNIYSPLTLSLCPPIHPYLTRRPPIPHTPTTLLLVVVYYQRIQETLSLVSILEKLLQHRLLVSIYSRSLLPL